MERKIVGDEIASEGGRERWSDIDGNGGRAGGGMEAEIQAGKNVPDSHGVYYRVKLSRSTAVGSVTDKTVNILEDIYCSFLDDRLTEGGQF